MTGNEEITFIGEPFCSFFINSKTSKTYRSNSSSRRVSGHDTTTVNLRETSRPS